jgi:hypothetical protein
MVMTFGPRSRARTRTASTSTVNLAGSTGAGTVFSRYIPAEPLAWCVTWPPMLGGGAMMVSPGSQIAMNAYRLAIAPDGTRTSAYRALNTSASQRRSPRSARWPPDPFRTWHRGSPGRPGSEAGRQHRLGARVHDVRGGVEVNAVAVVDLAVELDEPFQFAEHRRAGGVCRSRSKGAHERRAVVGEPRLWCESGHASIIGL